MLTITVFILLLLLLRPQRYVRCQSMTDTSLTSHMTLLGQAAHVLHDNARSVDSTAIMPSLLPAVIG